MLILLLWRFEHLNCVIQGKLGYIEITFSSNAIRLSPTVESSFLGLPSLFHTPDDIEITWIEIGSKFSASCRFISLQATRSFTLSIFLFRYISFIIKIWHRLNWWPLSLMSRKPRWRLTYIWQILESHIRPRRFNLDH